MWPLAVAPRTRCVCRADAYYKGMTKEDFAAMGQFLARRSKGKGKAKAKRAKL